MKEAYRVLGIPNVIQTPSPIRTPPIIQAVDDPFFLQDEVIRSISSTEETYTKGPRVVKDIIEVPSFNLGFTQVDRDGVAHAHDIENTYVDNNEEVQTQRNITICYDIHCGANF